MTNYRSLRAGVLLVLAGLAGALSLVHLAIAQPATNALPVGSCIVAYGESGRIVDKVQGGYRMVKDGDPDKIPVVVSGSSATPSACAGAAPPAQAAMAVAPAAAGGLAMGACVTAYGNNGRIVGTVQNGYRIAPANDPNGTPFVAPASDTRPSACAARAPAVVKAEPRPATPPPAQMAANAGAASCPASSAPAGLAARERTFAATLLSNWTTPARPGSDGATTAVIQSLALGPARTATFVDQQEYPVNNGAAIYPGRVKFTICTDYKTEADYHFADENFVCFTNAGGGAACSLAGHVAGLANPRDWSVKK